MLLTTVTSSSKRNRNTLYIRRMHSKSASVFCVYMVFYSFMSLTIWLAIFLCRLLYGLLFSYMACLIFLLNDLFPISLMFTKPCALTVASIVDSTQVRRLFWCSFVINMCSSVDCKDNILCLTVVTKRPT